MFSSGPRASSGASVRSTDSGARASSSPAFAGAPGLFTSTVAGTAAALPSSVAVMHEGPLRVRLTLYGGFEARHCAVALSDAGPLFLMWKVRRASAFAAPPPLP